MKKWVIKKIQEFTPEEGKRAKAVFYFSATPTIARIEKYEDTLCEFQMTYGTRPDVALGFATKEDAEDFYKAFNNMYMKRWNESEAKEGIKTEIIFEEREA